MGGRRIQAYTAIGRMDGACPYCVRDLPEWPTRSGPCPYCRGEILVRTRPLDRERVLATLPDEPRLEAEWELFRERGGDQPLRPLVDESEVERELAVLRARLGREPTEADAVASLISHRALTHMRTLELGHFRDLGLAKASLADQQGRWLDALAGYLGVCFLDLNGAHNPPRTCEGEGGTELPPSTAGAKTECATGDSTEPSKCTALALMPPSTLLVMGARGAALLW